MNKKVVDKKHFIFAKCRGGSGEVRNGPGEINLFQPKEKKTLELCFSYISIYIHVYLCGLSLELRGR